MYYCKHLRWVESQDADYYECALGLETSSDWCDDIQGTKSECNKFDPLPYPERCASCGCILDEEVKMNQKEKIAYYESLLSGRAGKLLKKASFSLWWQRMSLILGKYME